MKLDVIFVILLQPLWIRSDQCKNMELEPLEVALVIIDFTFHLTWRPPQNMNNSDLTYDVKSKLNGMTVSQVVASCRAIHELSCTFEPTDIISERVYGVEARKGACTSDASLSQVAVSPFHEIRLLPPHFSIEIFNHDLFVRPLVDWKQKSLMFKTLNIQYQVQVYHQPKISEITYKIANLASTEIEVEAFSVETKLRCVRLRFYNENLVSQRSTIGSGKWSPEQCINISTTSKERFSNSSVAVISATSALLLFMLCACAGFRAWEIYAEAKRASLPRELVETMKFGKFWVENNLLANDWEKEEAVACPIPPARCDNKNNVTAVRGSNQHLIDVSMETLSGFNERGSHEEVLTKGVFQHLLPPDAHQSVAVDRDRYNDFHAMPAKLTRLSTSSQCNWQMRKCSLQFLGFLNSDKTSYYQKVPRVQIPTEACSSLSGNSLDASYVTEHQMWNTIDGVLETSSRNPI